MMLNSFLGGYLLTLTIQIVSPGSFDSLGHLHFDKVARFRQEHRDKFVDDWNGPVFLA